LCGPWSCRSVRRPRFGVMTMRAAAIQSLSRSQQRWTPGRYDEDPPRFARSCPTSV
jgi:hypothetical protein